MVSNATLRGRALSVIWGLEGGVKREMIYETYSKRMKRLENSGQEDVYQYDVIPEPFRVQVIHIWRNTIGWQTTEAYQASPADEIWNQIEKILIREAGVFRLADGFNSQIRCETYIRQADTFGVIDIVELTFRIVDVNIRKMGSDYASHANASQSPDNAIEELNYRFREHALGYEYVTREIIRIDSQFIHAEVVKPAISLLHDARFSGPSQEFMKAHEFYRHGDHKQAITEALKALESTIKAICQERQWTLPRATPNANELVGVIFANGLIPTELQGYFGSLRGVLESGLATVRNRTSAHGQGYAAVEVPAHFAAYALHLAATNIVFMMEAHKAME